MADIYTRIPGDPNYVPNKIEITEDLEFILIQLELILFTRQHDVLGDLGFGGDLEDLIFTTNLSGAQIENVIRKQVTEYIPLANTYSIDVSCEFYKGVERDTAVLDITVDGRTAIGLLFA